MIAPRSAPSPQPFADLAANPAEHFRLYVYGAVLHLLSRVADALGSSEAALERFPFLVACNNELAERGADGLSTIEAARWWQDAVQAWERDAPDHLPLRALRDAATLDASALVLLVTIGLCDEDARFGAVFEFLHGAAGQRRPTMGLLTGWCAESATPAGNRAAVRKLHELGLVQPLGSDAPRAEWPLQVPALLWDAMRGEAVEQVAPWARYRAPGDAADVDALVLSARLRSQVAGLGVLLGADGVQALVVRGAHRNGRRTVIRALARQLGCGVLEIHGLGKSDDERWRMVGPLATLLHALPIIVLDLAPGETCEVPALAASPGLVAIVLGKQGGVSGPGVERALTLDLEIPDAAARRRHWTRGFAGRAVEDVETISACFRMTGGNVDRAARLAASHAALDRRDRITIGDVRQAARALGRESLDTLAAPVEVAGTWDDLAVHVETLQELQHLELRCRHREALQACAATGVQQNAGVRALFSGPSGTGKTLAARLLASVLGKDLYRIDLSSVVNKYIGETEKNLDRVFARAEELDVIAVLDEGDALLTQRTSVQSSNDRFGNLQTNYLLQRLESYDGILIVTTNAADRIDDAFARRMDVVIGFRPPAATERWAIWQLHLPPSHAVPANVLSEIASRCALSGGDIRNAVLHASLLALADGGTVGARHVEAAIHREYRKLGAVCPLRTNGAAARHAS